MIDFFRWLINWIHGKMFPHGYIAGSMSQANEVYELFMKKLEDLHKESDK